MILYVLPHVWAQSSVGPCVCVPYVTRYTPCVIVLNCVFLSFLASLSVDCGEDGVRQVAQTLQSCLELTEPVQQIQLIKKVSSNKKNVVNTASSHSPQSG